MQFGPTARKLNFTIHLISSLAWIGAVGAFLVLSVVGLRSADPATIRACYFSMDLIGRYLIFPLSVATIVIGVIQALGTPWGLVRHYWVLLKLVLTVGGAALLVLHQYGAIAEAARRPVAFGVQVGIGVGALGRQLVMDAALAIILLVVIAGIAVFKPWGPTPYSKEAGANREMPLSLKLFCAALGAMIIAFAIMHHAPGMNRH